MTARPAMEGDRQERARPLGAVRSLTVAGAAVLASVGVFVLPWLVPSAPRIVQSESLAVGFTNWVAAASLAIAMGLVFLATKRQLLGRLDERLLSLAPGGHAQRIGRGAIRAAIVVSTFVVIAQAVALGRHAHGDAAYFIDRMLRIAAGGELYSTVEFAYGPLLVYGPYMLWKLTGWTGMSIHAAYYLWVALSYAASIAVTAFVLDRVRIDPPVKTVMLLLFTAMTLLNSTLGVNYSPIRFLIPYALLLWAVERATNGRSRAARWSAPVAAVTLIALITPEMAVACLAALGCALAVLARRDAREHRGALLSLLAFAVALAVLLLGVEPGTLAAFAGGAYHLPVLPGPAALLYVASTLLVAWGVASDRDRSPESAAQIAWFAMSVILIVPALGRADFMHIFWNGAGIFLLCVASVNARWPNALRYYVAVTATVFLVSMVLFTTAYSLGGMKVSAARSVYEHPGLARTAAPLIGESSESAAALAENYQRVRSAREGAAEQLAALPDLGMPGLLRGEEGERAALSGDLVTVYYDPGIALNESDFGRSIAQLRTARYLALPTWQWEIYREAAVGARAREDGLVVSVPEKLGGAKWYGILLGFPVTLQGQNPILDPTASFGVHLEREWVEERTVGDYTLLLRREPLDDGDPGHPVRSE